MRKLTWVVVAACVLLGAVTPLSAQTAPPLNHVVVVAFENHSYSSVAGSSSMPYLNSLISSYALANGFYANTHPSIGNYLELTTGQVLTNNDSFNSTITADNIERELLKSGKTWKSYAQSIPSVGYTGWDVYPYVQHHNPFAFFSDNRNGSGQQNNIVPFTQFTADVANNTLPNFSFVVPDLEHDAHDCPNGSSSCTDADILWAADQFLQYQIAPLLNNAQFQKDGLLVIWFDEGNAGDTANGGGRVAITLVGPNVKKGYRSSTFYQHQSLLRTISEALGTPLFGDATNAPSMAEFFTTTGTSTGTSGGGTTSGGTSGGSSSPPTSTTVTVLSPAPGASVGSPVTFQATATSPDGIGGWVIYVDGSNAYQVDNNSNSLTAAVPLASGTHSVMIRAWDKVSGFGSSSTFGVSVGAGSGTTSGTGTSGTGTTPTSTTVTVLSPAAGSTVGSPVTFQVSATSPNGIGGWVIYVDGNNAYQVDINSNSLTTSLVLGSGAHTVMVRAWDKVSGFGSSPTFSLSVGSGSGTSASGSGSTGSGTGGTTPPVTATTVSVQTPANGAGVGSPVTFQASATSPNGISGWVIYADNNNVYQTNNGSNTLTASVSLAAGTHSIYIRAWDNVSGYGTSSTFSVTVGSGTSTTTSTSSTGTTTSATTTSVVLVAPTANATVGSPVTFQVSGSSPNGISGWVIYADGNNVYQVNNGSNSLTASVNLTPGTHTVYVRAWDNVSGYGTSSRITIDVP